MQPGSRQFTQFGTFRAAVIGICAGLATLAPLSAAKAAASEPQHVVVSLDRAKLLRMPDHVETIVVGSPIVADVSMLKRNGLVVITGKSYGETNIIFLDGAGQALTEALVTVERTPGLVTVQRGTDRESYSCTPRCEPALALGDATKYLQDTSGQITARNGLAVTPH